MSATVSYKGSTIATINNTTKVLKTTGTWVEDDIKITAVDEAPNVTQDQEGYVVLDDDGTPHAIVNPLSVASNGTYFASSGYAFNPVTVDILYNEDSKENEILDRTISGIYSNSAITSVGQYAFAGCGWLDGISLSRCTEIKNNAFYNCLRLSSIDLQSVKAIGLSAFFGCKSLTSITSTTFPNITTINAMAFAYCDSLSFVDLPSIKAWKMSPAGDYGLSSSVFVGCSNLTSVYLNSVQYIPSWCFRDCSRLTTISAPNASYIDSFAFTSCFRLSTISLSQVSTIYSYAFSGCSGLTTVSFPELSSIRGENAFDFCTSLTEINFPKLKEIIGAYAFNRCTNVSYINLPELTTMSGSSIFAMCSNLTTVIMPKLTSLSGQTFNSCIALSKVKFENLSYINGFERCVSLNTAIFYWDAYSYGHVDTNAFASCYKLLSLYLLAPTVYTLSYSSAFRLTPIDGYTSLTSGVYGSIFVPASLYSTYYSAVNWRYFSSRFVSLTDEQVSYVKEHGTHIMS